MTGPVGIGAMRERVAVWGESPPAANEYGEPVPARSQLAEVWAAVEPLGGRPQFRGERDESDAAYRVTVRHIPWLTGKHWFGWKGKTLRIDSLTDVEAAGEWLVCECVATGVDA